MSGRVTIRSVRFTNKHINTCAHAIDDRKVQFTMALLKWHEKHRRTFPWRLLRDPYRVLVAEIMLQRTRADQVAKIYEVFIEKFPDPSSVASADINAVHGLLEHLGLTHRIPRLIMLLKKLSMNYGGRVPDQFEELVKLPGVGPYIASAVLCFGFQKNVPIVDANVVRVFTRFFGISTSKRRGHTDPLFWKLAKELLPNENGTRFNEALLDFAALVCRPKPSCGICPVSSMCIYLTIT